MEGDGFDVQRRPIILRTNQVRRGLRQHRVHKALTVAVQQRPR
jgi:hypothetical protein